MNKILFCGDPHTMIPNLEDSQRLLDFIYETAQKQAVKAIVFTGDLFHNHAVVRLEILKFWRDNLTKLSELGIPVVVEAGNHDMVNPKQSTKMITAISNFEGIKNIRIVEDMAVFDFGVKVAVVGYKAEQADFLDRAQKAKDAGANVIVAHQTFTGAKYANGFYAEDGIDPALVPQDSLISGHIHSTMQIGKCFYVGSPKADNMADANVAKGIWVIDFANDGSSYEKTFFSTDDVVTCYKKFVVEEGQGLPPMNPKHKNYLELVGAIAWINSVKKELKGTENLQIKAVPTDVRINQEKRSIKGIDSFLDEYFKPIDGISKQQIVDMLSEL